MSPPVLDALRAALPWWVGVGPWLFVPVAALLSAIASYVATSIALLAMRGMPADAHWTERARRAWPARIVSAAGPSLTGIVLGVVASSQSGTLTWSPGLLGLTVGLTSFAAAYPQIARAARRTSRPRATFREALAGQAFVALVLYPHAFVAVVAASIMPEEPLAAALGAVVVLVVLIAIARGVGLRIAAALGLARPADERLARIVETCAAKIGVRPPRTWIVRWPMVNALAFARIHELAFTERAVRELSDRELTGVSAHELGHLVEPARVVFVRSLGIVAIAPVVLVRPVAAATGEGLLHTLAITLVLLAITLLCGRLVQRVARRMEERADAVAHAHEDDRGDYARALERIYELNLAPAVMRAKRPVHPHLYDRLVGAGLTPAYPRPAAPPIGVQRVAMLALIGLAGGGAIAWQLAAIFAEPVEGPPPMAIVAMRGGSHHDLRALGVARWEAGDLEGALPFYRALSELEPELAYWPAETARIEAWLGRCDDARRSLDEATRRATTIDPNGADAVPAAVVAVGSCSR